MERSTSGSKGRTWQERPATDSLEPQVKDLRRLFKNLGGLWPPASVSRRILLLLTTNALCWLADAPMMETFSAVVVAGTSSS